MTDPIRPTDQDARDMARGLMRNARFAALAVIDAEGYPLVTRVAFGLCPEGQPISLISALSAHTQALQSNAVCSMMVGEPGPKGDPLTHPRLSLQGKARFIPNNTPEHARLSEHYLLSHPKARLYIGFADFSFARMELTTGHLNGGFGKAYRLTPEDLLP